MMRCQEVSRDEKTKKTEFWELGGLTHTDGPHQAN